MDAAFLAETVSDTVLAALLLGLFVYASRIARVQSGILSWGWGHFLYTLGAALIDGGATRAAEGHPSTMLNGLAAVGSVLSACGLAALAWSATAIACQRPLTRLERLWMPLAAVVGGAAAAAFVMSPHANFAWPGLAMSVCEILALTMVALRMRRLDRVPYKLPARLVALSCVLLVVLYVGDVLKVVAESFFGRYVPNIAWAKVDLSLWFLLNFCMLMIVSFRAVETYRHWAYMDPLTGLLNRRGLLASLRARLEASADASAHSLCILMLDVDHFKSVNDRFGHAVGDAVLRGLARVVEGAVRVGDLPTRIGGEEFAIVLIDASPKAALDLAERVRVRMSQSAFLDAPASLRVTVSVGIHRGSLTASSFDEVLAGADAALYEAKNSGRNCVREFRGG